MDHRFVKLTDQAQFDRLIEESREHPVIIFKHSLSCSISASVYEDLTGFEGEIALLEVQKSRDLSQEIARRLGVVHESPQAMVLRNGQVVWNASHFRVNANALAAAVRQANGSAVAAGD